MKVPFSSFTKLLSNRFKPFEFNPADEVDDENSRWKSFIRANKKESHSDDHPVDKYKFLESFTGGTKPKPKEIGKEALVVYDVDEVVKERIVQSDVASQSSSSNPSSETSYCGGNFTTQESSVIINPRHVTYGRKRYLETQLTFFCTYIRLDVYGEGPNGSVHFEWKTADLVNIESRWCELQKTANVCLRVKSRHQEGSANDQNSGISEVKFSVNDPHWTHTQDLIKSLDARYKDKWDVGNDSVEAFEDTVYLEGDCGSISISKSDFQLLQPEKFINDTIVDFYIEYLKKQIKPADERLHFFNSFFFRKLADFHEDQIGVFDSKEAFQRVRKWTKKVNLFQKDYIFIPVNFRLHWSLIVICHPGEAVNFRDKELEKASKVPCILHMDSIKGSHRGLENCIKLYLWEEWKERNSDVAEDISSKFLDLRFLCLELPQQQNSYDCGLFMLHYMDLFVEKQASNNFNPLNADLGKNWFHPTEASLKRAQLKRLILELAKCNSQKAPLSGSADKCSSEGRDESDDEADIQFLHETCNSKEMCHGSKTDVKQRERNAFDGDGDVDGASSPTLLSCDLQLNGEQFPELQDNGESVIAENEQNYGQMVLYDECNIALSPTKEDEETEDVGEKQSAVTGIDKSLTLLRLKENLSAEESLRCCSSSGGEALVVEDSDDVCVVGDSDSEEHNSPPRRRLFGPSSENGSKRRRRLILPETHKRPKRSSSSSSDSEDVMEIFQCE